MAKVDANQTRDELIEALKSDVMAKQFVPYSYLSTEADALTIYFEGDPDYSERLNDHMTIYRSLETNELVGCRIKGIQGILADLPNYIAVDHDGMNLAVLFLPFRGAVHSEEDRNTLNDLARTVSERHMRLEACG